MEELIQVFRMTEIDPKTRAKIIIQLGAAINKEMAMNITESLVYELVRILDKENAILSNEHYIKLWERVV